MRSTPITNRYHTQHKNGRNWLGIARTFAGLDAANAGGCDGVARCTTLCCGRGAWSGCADTAGLD